MHIPPREKLHNAYSSKKLLFDLLGPFFDDHLRAYFHFQEARRAMQNADYCSLMPFDGALHYRYNASADDINCRFGHIIMALPPGFIARLVIFAKLACLSRPGISALLRFHDIRHSFERAHAPPPDGCDSRLFFAIAARLAAATPASAFRLMARRQPRLCDIK